MEEVITKNDFTSFKTLEEILENFFRDNNVDSVQLLFWKFFQCWVTKDCNIKTDISDEKIALFLDQLMDLVAAAYTLHQENRVTTNEQEGKGYE